MGLFNKLKWLGIGMGMAYLYDPISGRTRRAKLADQARSKMRRSADRLATKTRYQAGRAKGFVYEHVGAESQPRDDRELLQKVRSEALGPANGQLGHIEIDITNGVVHLTGTSMDRPREKELVERIKDVVGVVEVRNELGSS